jgi:hypothetical protein
LQIEIRLGAVIPLNGKFISDLLNVGRLQAHGLSILPECRSKEQHSNRWNDEQPDFKLLTGKSQNHAIRDSRIAWQRSDLIFSGL